MIAPMPEGGAFIPLRELGELDASDTSLARLRSEQDVLLRDMAQNHDGGRSRTRAVRDRSPEEHHRLELRYEAVCRDIHRLEGSSRDQAAQRIADWARSRPIAAQEVMRLLPPGAIVRTIQPFGNIESNTLALAVYYADDGHTIGIVPMPMGAADGLGTLEAEEILDIMRRHVQMVTPDRVALVPGLTSPTQARVAELLAD
jgi:hypothetical protein